MSRVQLEAGVHAPYAFWRVCGYSRTGGARPRRLQTPMDTLTEWPTCPVRQHPAVPLAI